MWKIEISAKYEYKNSIPNTLIEGLKEEIVRHMKAYGFTEVECKSIEEK